MSYEVMERVFRIGKEEFSIDIHPDEYMGSIRERVAEKIGIPSSLITLYSCGALPDHGRFKEFRSLYSSGATIFIKEPTPKPDSEMDYYVWKNCILLMGRKDENSLFSITAFKDILPLLIKTYFMIQEDIVKFSAMKILKSPPQPYISKEKIESRGSNNSPALIQNSIYKRKLPPQSLPNQSLTENKGQDCCIL
jgi:hypothetical protein